MRTTLKRVISWSVPVLAVMSLAAAGRDLRLVEAVKGQNHEAIRSLLKAKADVNVAQPDGATALHWAAYRNDLETADLLIRAGARPNATNDNGVTPLWLACSSRNAAMVDRLLTGGADPNIALLSGETSLMRCAYTGNASAVSALLARGANVNAKEGSKGQTALMWAVAEQHADVVRILLEHKADISARTAITKQRAGDGKVGTNGPGGTLAIEKGGFTPILFAARHGALESAQALVAAGANVNDAAGDDNTALVIASHSGHGKLAAFLLDKGADPNAAAAGYTALHSAVVRSDVELVKALLAHKADVNARITKGTPVPRFAYQWILPATVIGMTPYQLAAKYAEVEIMRVLASGGADTVSAMKDGTTPLMMAAGYGWPGTQDRRHRIRPPEEVKSLVENGEGQAMEAVKLALELGSDVNAVNDTGSNALHGAASKGFKGIVQFLVEKGGNAEAKNKAGRTPMDMLRGPGELGIP